MQKAGKYLLQVGVVRLVALRVLHPVGLVLDVQMPGVPPLLQCKLFRVTRKLLVSR